MDDWNIGRLQLIGAATVKGICRSHPGCHHLINYRHISHDEAQRLMQLWIAVGTRCNKGDHQLARY